ncbi:MAG: hypothetical protein GXX94_10840 [Chloroflexi bacterium]|nr:hypothetical protein [Chloroflexota bacterium]
MERNRSTIIWGIVLVCIGGLLLLGNLGVLGKTRDLLWSVLFLGGGAVFAGVYIQNRSQWWAIIPAGVLVSIGALIGYEQFLAPADEIIGPAIFFVGMGCTFFAVYLLHRENWWAIIPGGVLLTLAVVVCLAETANGELAGAAMMFGMALTFAVLSLLNTPDGRLRWALIPAGILGALGCVILLQAGEWAGYITALIPIAAGLFMIFRASRTRREE